MMTRGHAPASLSVENIEERTPITMSAEQYDGTTTLQSAEGDQFTFGVRCRFGRMFGVAFTASLVAFCFIVYVVEFVAPLATKSPAAGYSVLGVLLIVFGLIMTSFVRVCSTHPGRVPSFFTSALFDERVRRIFNEYVSKHSLGDAAADDLSNRFGVKTSAVGLVPSLRRCDICDVYKVETCHHCSSCGTCVFEMDHHCPWVGVCIGHQNHKYFLLFLFYVIVGAVLIVCSAAVAVLSERGIENGLLFVSWIVCCVFMIILAPFLFSSLQTVYQNTSTIAKMQSVRRGESIRGGAVQQRSPTKRALFHAAPLPPTAAQSEHPLPDGPRRNSAEGASEYVAIDVADERRSSIPPVTEQVAMAQVKGTSSVSKVSQGLRRVFGIDDVVPWWFLPIAPRHDDAEDESQWTHQLVLEVHMRLDTFIRAMVESARTNRL